jgi:hypothetical protein
MSTLPIVTPGGGPAGSTTHPQWAQGGGWATEFGLVNPSDLTITGQIVLLQSNGQPWETLQYSIPPRSSRRLTPTQNEPTVRVGSARITPASGAAPSGVAVFRYTLSGVAVTEGGVPAMAGGVAFRGYGEISTAVRTGLAIANVSASAANVVVNLSRLDGTPIAQTGNLSIPASGHRALFLNEVPGLSFASGPFQGMVRITSDQPVALTALRGRTNERGDFLIAATVPVDEAASSSSPELLFPHLIIGSGWDMQFVLMDASAPGGQDGIMLFFGQNGQPLPLMVP